MENTEIVWFVALLLATGVVSGFMAGLFGIGGGAILVPILYQVFETLGVSQEVSTHVAVGSSLAIIIPTSIRSFLAHKKTGKVDMDLLRFWAIFIILGALSGGFVANYISGEGLRLIFAVFVAIIAAKMLFGRSDWRFSDTMPSAPYNGVYGFLIGLSSSLIGIGGGIITTSIMVLHNRLIHQAVATASGVGILISIPGMTGFVISGLNASGLPFGSMGYVNWIVVAIVAPIGILVAPLGVKVAHRLDRRYLEMAIGLFLVSVSIRFFLSL